ncbi:prepilin-type N-terminal cleavage/methylation domain-containing protein [bacterium]|nr:prepilin-type N-terminal cleavage/methylation domain-containing protein [bacterium]
MFWTKQAQTGLTLVELLVVTVILGLLSAAVVSKIGAAINRAKKAAMMSYMVSELRGALRDYRIDHGSYPAGAGPVDPTVVLKAEGYLTSTLSDKSIDLNVTLNALYYAGPFPSVSLPGVAPIIAADDYWYVWCFLSPVADGLDLPCAKVTAYTLEESASLATP